MEEKALQHISHGDDLPAIRAAARAWAEATTDRTLDRRADLVSDKSKVVISFCVFSSKDPAEVRALDVKEW